jgi:hypothetical protein
MGLAAGGRMRQDVYQDPFGRDVWDVATPGVVCVHIVNSEQYLAIMSNGSEPPGTPVDAAAYTAHGLPWFDLYDEHHARVASSDRLSRVTSIAGMDRKRGKPPREDDHSIDVPEGQLRRIGRQSRQGKARKGS